MWLGACAIVTAAWLYWAHVRAGQNSAGAMITAKVLRGDLVESVSATGSVTAQTGAEVNIGTQITGIIKHLYADVDSHVKAGQLIAQLNLPDLEAQVVSSQAALSAARTKLQQVQTGTGMTDTQVEMAIAQAQQVVASAGAKLSSAQATAKQFAIQTPTDVSKAETALASGRDALTTAVSVLAQTQAGAALQVSTAQNQHTQAVATALNGSLDYGRQESLAAQGAVAQNVADQARATTTVDAALVSSAAENILLVQQKVAADLLSATDAVSQARQTVQSDVAALAAATSESYTVLALQANVVDAAGARQQAIAVQNIAVGNLPLIEQQRQNVLQAQEAVRQAVGQLAVNQADLDKTFIRTPIAGTVLQLAAQQGDTLAAGLSAPTLIVVADLKRLQVDAFVDESDIGTVADGQTVDIVLDAFPKHTFVGKVSKISAGSTIQNGVVTYDVTVAITQEPAYALKPDMTANVTIQTGRRSKVLLVSSVAVQVGLHGSTVNVLSRKDGKTIVTPVEVQTGGTDGVNTEITTGLTEGATIVLAGGNSQGTGGPASAGTSPFSTASHSGGRGG